MHAHTLTCMKLHVNGDRYLPRTQAIAKSASLSKQSMGCLDPCLVHKPLIKLNFD
jgi:hypothetical protein